MLPPASAAIFTSYLYHSTSAGPRSREGIRRQPVPHRPPANVDASIIGIIDAPLAPSESALFGVTRKEAELLALFASLTVAQSRALHARLRSPNSTDLLAAKLAKLGIDRKQRLIWFLGRHRFYR
jgi:hypothetical protein